MRRIHLLRAVRLLGLALIALAAGAAGPCGLEKRAELPLAPAPVPVVEAEIAGQPARLIVDTGAAVMVLNQEAVERLGLRRDLRQRFELRGIGGGGSSVPAIVGDLTLGGIELPEQRAAIVPPGPRGPALAGVDGLLGLPALRGFDIALDMPARRLTLYRGSPCDESEVPLSGEIARVATSIDRERGLLALKVRLDNTPYRAMLDTGAQASIVVDRVAALSDWVLAGDRQARMRGVGPEMQGAHRHRFQELAVGDDAMARPLLLVSEDPGTAFDVVLGMDYLAPRRIFLSFSTNTLYVQKPAAR